MLWPDAYYDLTKALKKTLKTPTHGKELGSDEY